MALRETTQTADSDLFRQELSNIIDLRHPLDWTGRLRIDFGPDPQPSQWLTRKEKACVLVGYGAYVVEIYLDEEAVKRIKPGDCGICWLDAGAGPAIALKVVNVDANATRVLTNGMLAVHAPPTAQRTAIGQTERTDESSPRFFMGR